MSYRHDMIYDDTLGVCVCEGLGPPTVSSPPPRRGGGLKKAETKSRKARDLYLRVMKI